MRPCPSRRRELAELVDGTLSVREQERLNAHLAWCGGCQDEVASLRDVRDRLRVAGSNPSASTELTDRLLSIAGPEAGRPLYARPFDRSRAQALPTPRRRTRQAVAGVMAFTFLLFAGLVGAGWAAAPPSRAAALDPGPVARDEFAAVLGEAPLSNPAVTATRARELSQDKTEAATSPPAVSAPLVTGDAESRLTRANEARFRIAYAGVQTVQIRHLAGYWVTDVEVKASPGQGTRVAFPDRGLASPSALLAEPPPTDLRALAHTHELLTGPGPVVAGRRSVVVEAHQAGQPRARWWLDDETSLVLWQQTLDAHGDVTVSSGYRSITVGQVEHPRHLPPRLAPPATMANLTSIDALAGRGFQCSETLAGLPLIRARGDRDDSMLHTAYGDGVDTVSVFQQKGALGRAPDGFVWDPERRAYRSLGLTTMYSWQSGDAVFTVATDGSAELADRAMAELPHAKPVLRTRVDRVLDGWRHLVGLGA